MCKRNLVSNINSTGKSLTKNTVQEISGYNYSENVICDILGHDAVQSIASWLRRP
jgi:nicotinic acid mononucleotide adenylyltransferase